MLFGPFSRASSFTCGGRKRGWWLGPQAGHRFSSKHTAAGGDESERKRTTSRSDFPPTPSIPAALRRLPSPRRPGSVPASVVTGGSAPATGDANAAGLEPVRLSRPAYRKKKKKLVPLGLVFATAAGWIRSCNKEPQQKNPKSNLTRGTLTHDNPIRNRILHSNLTKTRRAFLLVSARGIRREVRTRTKWASASSAYCLAVSGRGCHLRRPWSSTVTCTAPAAVTVTSGVTPARASPSSTRPARSPARFTRARHRRRRRTPTSASPTARSRASACEHNLTGPKSRPYAGPGESIAFYTHVVVGPRFYFSTWCVDSTAVLDLQVVTRSPPPPTRPCRHGGQLDTCQRLLGRSQLGDDRDGDRLPGNLPGLRDGHLVRRQHIWFRSCA